MAYPNQLKASADAPLSSISVVESVGNKSIAPWWHTAVVVLILGISSAASAYEHGLPNLNLPGMSVRLSGYLTVIAEEWLIVLVIWFALKQRGLSIGHLISGRWQNLRAFFKDLGLAIGFLCVGIPLTSGMIRLFGAHIPGLEAALPKTALEALGWVLLSLTGGFCEELIFRGYIMHQFTAWSDRKSVGIGLQGVTFGLSHGYQGPVPMCMIIVYGCLFGMLASWRKSLRPGMLAHGLQDVVGGLVAFFVK